MSSLVVFTSRIWLPDPDLLNVTRGSGGEAGAPFAPSFRLLGQAKRGELTFDEYTPRYLAEMRVSYGIPPRKYGELEWQAFRIYQVKPRPDAWATQLARERVIFGCYEVDRDNCHRGLLAAIFVKLGAIDGGEIPLPTRRTEPRRAKPATGASGRWMTAGVLGAGVRGGWW